MGQFTAAVGLNLSFVVYNFSTLIVFCFCSKGQNVRQEDQSQAGGRCRQGGQEAEAGVGRRWRRQSRQEETETGGRRNEKCKQVDLNAGKSFKSC